jgi:hypothetical protein
MVGAQTTGSLERRPGSNFTRNDGAEKTMVKVAIDGAVQEAEREELLIEVINRSAISTRSKIRQDRPPRRILRNSANIFFLSHLPVSFLRLALWEHF